MCPPQNFLNRASSEFYVDLTEKSQQQFLFENVRRDAGGPQNRAQPQARAGRRVGGRRVGGRPDGGGLGGEGEREVFAVCGCVFAACVRGCACVSE